MFDVVVRNEQGQVRSERGRWTDLTPELHAALIASVEIGLFENQIATKNGIHPKTLYRWLDVGTAEDGYEPFKSFAEEFLRRTAEIEAEAIRKIREAGDPSESIEAAKCRGDWKATAWWLERRHPLRWGTRVTNPGVADSYVLPQPTNRSAKAKSVFEKPTPELLKAIESAGMQLVPLVVPVSNNEITSTRK